MATAVLDSILEPGSVSTQDGPKDVSLLCTLPDGETANIAVLDSCQIDSPVAYCPTAVVQDDVVYGGQLRNASVTNGVLPLVPASVPPSILDVAFGERLLSSSCAACSTVGAQHRAVPVCARCFRETVVLSAVQGTSAAQMQAGPTGVRVDPGTWLHFNSGSDLLDVRGVCCDPECGFSGAVAVGFACCGAGGGGDGASPPARGCTSDADMGAAFSPSLVGQAGASRCKVVWDGREAGGLCAALRQLWGGAATTAQTQTSKHHK